MRMLMNPGSGLSSNIWWVLCGFASFSTKQLWIFSPNYNMSAASREVDHAAPKHGGRWTQQCCEADTHDSDLACWRRGGSRCYGASSASPMVSWEHRRTTWKLARWQGWAADDEVERGGRTRSTASWPGQAAAKGATTAETESAAWWRGWGELE
jgi:hypothetical protein